MICEKPLALNADEAKEMFDTAKASNVYLMEAYAYLHSPYIDSLKKDIASGIIGDVDYIETAFVTQGYKEDIRLHKDLGGGAMYDLKLQNNDSTLGCKHSKLTPLLGLYEWDRY